MWMTHLLRPDVIVQNHRSIKVTAFRSFLSCQTAGIDEDFPVVDEWYGVGNEDDQQGEAYDDNDDVVWCAEEEVVEKETKADNEHHGVTGRHQPRSSRCVHRQSCLINLLKNTYTFSATLWQPRQTLSLWEFSKATGVPHLTGVQFLPAMSRCLWHWNASNTQPMPMSSREKLEA